MNRAQVSEEFGTLAGADLVVAITEEDAAHPGVRKAPSDKMFTLPYAVFDSPAAPSDDGAFRTAGDSRLPGREDVAERTIAAVVPVRWRSILRFSRECLA